MKVRLPDPLVLEPSASGASVAAPKNREEAALIVVWKMGRTVAPAFGPSWERRPRHTLRHRAGDHCLLGTAP